MTGRVSPVSVIGEVVIDLGENVFSVCHFGEKVGGDFDSSGVRRQGGLYETFPVGRTVVALVSAPEACCS